MSKSVKKIISTLTLLVGVFFVYHFVFAQTDLGLSYGNSIGLAATDPRIVVGKIIQIFLGLLGIIALVLIIYGGFLWMTAGGNEEQIDRAKKTLISAIIGLAIILASFGIATFILNSLIDATNNNGGGNNGGNNNGGGGNSGTVPGSGAIGACGVSNVYPASGQTGVARNTALLVTFAQPVNPANICASANCSSASALNTTNVQIYQTAIGNAPATNVQAQVSTADNKTFTIIPTGTINSTGYLGTAGQDTVYQVDISGVNLAIGGSAFGGSGCPSSLSWQFTVSGNNIDLIPPQVSAGGVFPPPDSGADTANNSKSVQAAGSITVKSQPKIFAAASAVAAATDSKSGTPSATVAVDPNINVKVSLDVLVSIDGLSAAVKSGGVGLGTANINNKVITYSGNNSFTLTSSAVPAAGNEWTITITAGTPADSLAIGSDVFTFVKTSAAGNQIAVGADTAGTAQNIAAALALDNNISVLSTAGSKISVGAAQVGTAGDNIAITTNDKPTFDITALSGGADGSNGATTVGAPDQPMNTIIQINFNKPVLPTAVSGDAATVKAIQVVDDTGAVLSGKFVISNQYQTVEFIPSTQCGINGCGEPIYCLPANSHLTVKINAAALATCSGDASCDGKGAYTTCGTYCHNSTGQNYPQAQLSAITTAVVDTSLNSLDGNRDGNAQGPASYYNQNLTAPSAGDSYEWSFYINGQTDTTAPQVVSTIPAVGSGASALANQDIKINFDKIMMASTLTTGSTVTSNGQANITNKNINLWSPAGNSVGYWIQTETVLTNGSPSATNAIIKHGDFSGSTTFNAQAGSGVEDIHENCFKPSGTCPNVSASSPSCCNGVATPASQLGPDGNCP
jgi:energy-coupling factor transporter transmembrane protein EcfT